MENNVVNRQKNGGHFVFWQMYRVNRFLLLKSTVAYVVCDKKKGSCPRGNSCNVDRIYLQQKYMSDYSC